MSDNGELDGEMELFLQLQTKTSLSDLTKPEVVEKYNQLLRIFMNSRYIHTYIQTYIHTYIHIYIHTYIHTHTYTYNTYTYIHIDTYIHTYTILKYTTLNYT